MILKKLKLKYLIPVLLNTSWDNDYLVLLTIQIINWISYRLSYWHAITSPFKHIGNRLNLKG